MTRTVMRISHQYWLGCDSPDPDDDLFKRCLYIGLGPSAIMALSRGLAGDPQEIHDISDMMGYKPDDFRVEVTSIG